jgi:hypothetical protein
MRKIKENAHTAAAMRGGGHIVRASELAQSGGDLRSAGWLALVTGSAGEEVVDHAAESGELARLLRDQRARVACMPL